MRARYGLVGRGRAARSIEPLLWEGGDEITWWWSLGDPGDTAELAPVDVVVFAVPDGAIEAAAGTFAARPGAAREIWLHLSGSRPAEVLRVSPEIPRAAGCMHPLVALTGRPDRAHLAGATAGIDGDALAVGAAEALARQLGLAPRRLAPGTKALYHAAAVTVAGHAMALFDQALTMLTACGLSAADARAALQPLMRGAVANLEHATPAQAITGPIARGDAPTVAAHLAAIAALERPELTATYRLLARGALTLSREAIEPGAATALRALLDAE